MALRIAVSAALLAGCLLTPARAAPADPTPDQARSALRRAVKFFRESVATEGGYLWQYSADLTLREGEGKATASQIWVQTPGTPRVGQAYLDAYRHTGDSYLLEAARSAAAALVRGQLRSGGWDYRVEFDDQRRERYAYRVDPARSRARDVTVLDDDNTQSALRFLMQLDRELQLRDQVIHECVTYALEHLLAAQYPNGAWPQRYSAPPDPAAFPVLKANYPDSWSREFTKPAYAAYYTLNDNTLADMISTMLLASGIYGEPRYRAAAQRAGDFLILAQMPAPQPAWAQQYNPQMQPAWARKFEPPSITGGESQGVMRVLLELYRVTGEQRYLQPIPRALAYLRESQLPDGRLARFYELKTNRPLYFTTDYQLTYDDGDMPTHYAFIVSSQLKSIQQGYERAVGSPWEPPAPQPLSTKPVRNERHARRVRAAIAALDERGGWVEPGQLRYQDGPADSRIIRCRTFVENIRLLSQYIGRDSWK
jgi:PelA/Pel-15E family pectate lyase